MTVTTIRGLDARLSQMQNQCPDYAQDIEQFIWSLFLIDSVVEETLSSAGYEEFSVHDKSGMFGRRRRYHSYKICDRSCFVSFHWKKNRIDDVQVNC